MINLRNIYLNNGNNNILNNISLSITSKEPTIISGHNGSGKTSLLKIIGNIITPNSGVVEYENKLNIKKTSFSFQEPIFLNRSVESNLVHALTCYNRHYSNKYKQLIKKTLNDFDLLKIINNHADKLSAGEKKLISYIRSIILEPEILFLDEPYAYLDDKYANVVSNHIQYLSNKIKIILVTHANDNTNKLTSNIITMNQGKIE